MAQPRSIVFNRGISATPAEVKETTFIPEGNSTFSYTTTPYINIPLKSTLPNCFLDASHSFLRFTVQNTSAVPIYFDGLSSCIIKTLKIMQGNSVTIEQTENYHRLVDLFTEHFASESWAREQAITSGMAMKETVDEHRNELIPQDDNAIQEQ